MVDLKNHIISESAQIAEALTKLNEHSGDVLLLFVVDEAMLLLGAITDGDVRRGLIKGVSLSDAVSTVMNKEIKKIKSSENLDAFIKEIVPEDIKLLPIVNLEGELVSVVNLLEYKSQLPVEGIIMAGGRGERLRPMTDSIPKPLLKIGGKSIVEYNIDRLQSHGITDVHFSIKYLGHEIENYFGDGKSRKLNISYIKEDVPLGTIGSLSLVKSFSKDNILVMNSDLLTDIDFKDFVNEFLAQKADLMVATIPYEVNIPYAVMETDNNLVTSLKEKPTYTYQSNAGIYIMKKEVVGLIPKASFFNATDLMSLLISRNKKVVYYPILGYWLDIGKPQDFEKAQIDIKHLKL
jgi:dTDP-glucose pyrophosphorylase